MTTIKTLKPRLNDKHASALAVMALKINMAGNDGNETSHRAIRECHTWLGGFDPQKPIPKESP